MSKRTVGKLVFGPPIITNIIHKKDGYWFIGHSRAAFGFIYPWKVGPYKTISAGFQDFNTGGNIHVT